MPLLARQARAEAMRGVREVRRIARSAELRDAADGMVSFAGLACRTGTVYDMGWFDEQIVAGAFTETLKRNPDVQLLVNHEGLPIARTTIPAALSGALALRESGDGLEFDAPNCDATDPDVTRVAAKVRSGLMDQCSFAFRVVKQRWTWVSDEEFDNGTARDQREILEVNMDRGDVSIVNYGASPTTTVTARSLLAAMTDTEIRELDPDVLARIRRATRAADDCDCDPDDPDPDCDCQDEDRAAKPAAPVHDLAFYRARTRALQLR